MSLNRLFEFGFLTGQTFPLFVRKSHMRSIPSGTNPLYRNPSIPVERCSDIEFVLPAQQALSKEMTVFKAEDTVPLNTYKSSAQ